MEELEKRVQVLEDLEEIKKLKVRYPSSTTKVLAAYIASKLFA